MIRIGVAGWDYPDWAGVVYPGPAPRGFDRLAYLSRYVDVIEVNSTFYRPADPRVAEGWLRRTASRDGFVFTAKAHRSWTHEKAPALAAEVPATLLGLAPLRDADRLGAVLVQFPQGFRAGPDAFAHCEAITRAELVLVETQRGALFDEHRQRHRHEARPIERRASAERQLDLGSRVVSGRAPMHEEAPGRQRQRRRLLR